MHADLVYRFIELQALLITPIAPHFAEHLWSDPSLLNNPNSVQVARFPMIDATVDHGIITSAVYVRTTLKEIRDAELTYIKRKAKGKATGAYDPSQPKGVKIYVAGGFPEWQDTAVAIVLSAFDEGTGKVDDKLVREGVQAKGLGKDKKVMPFIATFKVWALATPARASLTRILSTRNSLLLRAHRLPSIAPFPSLNTTLSSLPFPGSSVNCQSRTSKCSWSSRPSRGRRGGARQR
jgi:leucyl-tRNA synthetase